MGKRANFGQSLCQISILLIFWTGSILIYLISTIELLILCNLYLNIAIDFIPKKTSKNAQMFTECLPKFRPKYTEALFLKNYRSN